jgi:ubiquinone/menaquinone biosynthesis C-methylase UbiE
MISSPGIMDNPEHDPPELPRPTIRQQIFAWVTAKTEEGGEEMLRRHKQDLFKSLSGTVLEIGPGTGANLRYYPAGIRWIAVEPNPAMHGYLQKKAAERDIKANFRLDPAEALNLPDDSVDTAISTLVLCSVDDLDQVLAEIHRVLKPGGRFLFLEHVAAPEGSWQRRGQDFIQPVWSFFAGGCRPNRETGQALEQAGFKDLDYANWHLGGPITSPMISGVAVKG